MWGTFVLDSYRWDQRRELPASIEEIASGTTQPRCLSKG